MADQIAFKDKEIFSLSLLDFGFQKNTIVCKIIMVFSVWKLHIRTTSHELKIYVFSLLHPEMLRVRAIPRSGNSDSSTAALLSFGL